MAPELVRQMILACPVEIPSKYSDEKEQTGGCLYLLNSDVLGDCRYVHQMGVAPALVDALATIFKFRCCQLKIPTADTVVMGRYSVFDLFVPF